MKSTNSLFCEKIYHSCCVTRIDELSKNETVRKRIICGANLVAELQKHRSKEIAQDSCLLGSLQDWREHAHV